MPKKKPTPRVRPPRAPKGESPFVTIANLENHVSLLTRRVEELVLDREELRSQNNQFRTVIDTLSFDRDSARANSTHFAGYIERVREEDRHRYGDLPGSSA